MLSMVLYNMLLRSAEMIWPRGQAVKTSPFHGGNTGSIPVGVSSVPMWLNLLRLTTSIAGRALITNQLLKQNMPMWLNWQSS